MNLRDALYNLALTAGIIIVLLIGAIIFKSQRTDSALTTVPRAIPIAIGEDSQLTLHARPVTEHFQRIISPELVVTRANEADTLRIRHQGTEDVFVLYFIDAMESTTTHPQLINDQSRWFGNAPSERILQIGEEARDYVTQLLQNRPFEIRTHWERIPNTLRYYALIVVEHQPQQHVYLADLLLRKGYARLHGLTTPLPFDPRSEEDYIAELRQISNLARKEKAGIWAYQTAN
jgi:endonuclease YncB( thermonuclease family)